MVRWFSLCSVSDVGLTPYSVMMHIKHLVHIIFVEPFYL